jgi:hypothetical protein
MDTKLSQFENEINTLKINRVDLDSIIQLKQFTTQLQKFEWSTLWAFFQPDLDLFLLESLELLESFNIKLESIIEICKNKKDSPIIVIHQIKKLISSAKLLTENPNSKLLDKIDVALTKLYIKHEDYQEDIETKTLYLYNLIDDNFGWLDTNPEYISLTDFIDKISNEIYDNFEKYVDKKKQFYLEYFQEKCKQMEQSNVKLFICNFTKNYILNNFGPVFDQICLDVLELNGIKDENEIKKIITLCYDHTKQNVKLLLEIKLDNSNE